MLGQLPNLWWALVLVGLAAGIVSGALGVGSGIVFVPILVMIFALPQKSAQGTALAVMVPMALLGAFRYWHNPDIEINMSIVAFLAVGALVGALIGTELANRVEAHWLRKAFAVFMVIVAVRMFLMRPEHGRLPADPTSRPRTNVTETGDKNGD